MPKIIIDNNVEEKCLHLDKPKGWSKIPLAERKKFISKTIEVFSNLNLYCKFRENKLEMIFEFNSETERDIAELQLERLL